MIFRGRARLDSRNIAQGWTTVRMPYSDKATIKRAIITRVVQSLWCFLELYRCVDPSSLGTRPLDLLGLNLMLFTYIRSELATANPQLFHMFQQAQRKWRHPQSYQCEPHLIMWTRYSGAISERRFLADRFDSITLVWILLYPSKHWKLFSRAVLIPHKWQLRSCVLGASYRFIQLKAYPGREEEDRLTKLSVCFVRGAPKSCRRR